MADDEKKRGQGEKGESAADKRKHARVDFFNSVKVVVPEDDTAIDMFASNVSEGGIFLRSNRPLPTGKKVELKFETEKGPVQVEEGEVAWSKEFEPISIDGTSPGMGVKFKQITPESQTNISTFIEEMMGSEGEPAADEPVDLQAPAQASTGEPAGDKKTGEQAATADPLGLPPAPKPLVEDASPGQMQQSPPGPSGLKMKLSLASKAAPPPRPPAAEQADGREAPPSPQQSAAPEAAAQEDTMAVLSKPPPPRTRLLLFIGFVLLVAAVTFFTLMWLKPFETKPAQPETPASEADKPSVADTSPSKAGHASTETVEPPKSGQPTADPESGEAKRPSPTPSGDGPTASATADPKPIDTEPAATVEPKGKTADEKQPPATDRPPTATTAAGPPVLMAPAFVQQGSDWQLTLRTTKAVRFRYFTLKDPPRLAIDVKKAEWKDAKLPENPPPFVQRVRFGKQPDAVRLVLDFVGKRLPKFKTAKGPDHITFTFNSVGGK